MVFNLTIYQTPLHIAVLSRSFECVSFLVEVPTILLKAQDSNAILKTKNSSNTSSFSIIIWIY